MFRSSHREQPRYVAEACASADVAIQFIKKFPDKFFLRGGFDADEIEVAERYWRKRIRKLEEIGESLWFIRDTMTNHLIGLDLRHAAQSRALLYSAVAAALGQSPIV